MAGPNPTCGYIQGLATSSLTCGSGYCGFNSNLGAAGCCTSAFSVGGSYSLTGCNFITSCYAATDIVACDRSCDFNTHDLLCSNPASPECVKYTFTDVSSAALSCSDKPAVIDIAMTFADTVKMTSLSPSAGVAGSTSAAATAHPSFGSDTSTSSYMPPATTASSATVASTSSATSAGASNPFSLIQASEHHTGGVGTATPVAKGNGGRMSGFSRALRLVACSMLGLALIIV